MFENKKELELKKKILDIEKKCVDEKEKTIARNNIQIKKLDYAQNILDSNIEKLNNVIVESNYLFQKKKIKNEWVQNFEKLVNVILNEKTKNPDSQLKTIKQKISYIKQNVLDLRLKFDDLQILKKEKEQKIEKIKLDIENQKQVLEKITVPNKTFNLIVQSFFEDQTNENKDYEKEYVNQDEKQINELIQRKKKTKLLLIKVRSLNNFIIK